MLDGELEIRISIHAPRVGSDRLQQKHMQGGCYFNPRSPCGERLFLLISGGGVNDFNPRSPCGERQPHEA